MPAEVRRRRGRTMPPRLGGNAVGIQSSGSTRKSVAAKLRQTASSSGGAAGTKKVSLMRGPTGFGMVVQSGDCCLSGYSVPGGPAELAGIPIGSRILEVNGSVVSSKKVLMSEIKFGGARIDITFRPPQKKLSSRIQCEAGHSLAREPRLQHTCDLCMRRGTHFACPAGCDYDLCGDCYEKLTKNAQEKAARK